MPTQVQFRRGTSAQNNAFTGAVGELTIDTSTYAVRVHDGITAGGSALLPTLKITNAERLAITPAQGQFVFVTDYASAGVAPTWLGDGSTVGGIVSAGATVSSASTATNLAGGTAGQLAFQSAPGVTSFAGPGSYGQFLFSNGTNGPQYTSTLTYVAGSVKVNGTANATSTTTGALIVAGGVGVAGDIFVGGKIVAQELDIQYTTVTTTLITTDDIIRTSNTTPTSSTTTGALQIAGGVGIGGDVFVGGNITAQGNIIANGNITLGNQVTDTITLGAEVISDVLPGTTNTYNLGSGSLAWNRLYVKDVTASGTVTATTFVGAMSQSLSAGTGLTGSAYNGSAAQTWTLNTATLMQTAVNLGSGAAGSLPYQTAANATGFLAIGTNGYVLTSNGTAPTWTALTGLSAGLATTATNLAGGTAGQVPYQTAGGSTSFYGPGTAGQILLSNGAAAPVYTNTASIYIQDANVSTNVRAGTAGQLVYQTAANTSGFINTATTGNFLQANYTGAPTWTSTGSMYVNRATLSDLATTATSAATAYATMGTLSAGVGLTGTSFNGSANYTWTLNTATLMQVATQVVQSHSTGTGILGAAYNGSTAQTWSLDTSTLMAKSVTLVGGTAGQLVYQSAANTSGFINTATTGNFLQANYVGAPTWTTTASMYVQDAVVSTNIRAGAAGSIPYQSGANATTFLGIGTNGYVLTSNGTAPTWAALSGLSAGLATTATNLAGGTAGQVPYQTAGGVTSFYGPGTAGQLLVSAGASAPVYTNTASIYIQDANVSTNLRAGTAGQLHYQTAANTSGFINTATTGNFLQANYVGAPTWTTTASMYVQDAVVSTNLRAGAAGSLPYQTAANATGFVSIAASGNMLISNGSTPAWAATSTIYVNRATISDQVLTTLQTGNASYYPTFVDTNNASATAESVYTTSSFYVNPTTGLVNLQNLSVNGTGYSTSTGVNNALYVAGGAFINSGLTVGTDAPVLFKGPVTFAGTATYAYSTNTVYTDNILNMHTPPGGTPSSHTWTLDDGKDIGFIFHYYKSADKDAFLGIANDTSYLEWYENGSEANGVFTGTTYGTFKTGAIKLAGGAANSGNTSSGDLTVLGGVGVGGSIYVGGNITVAGTINASITGVSTTATNIAGGTAGQVPYQSAAGITSFVNTATTGNFLQANYTGAPTWTSTGSMYVYRATVADTVNNFNTSTLMTTAVNLAGGTAGQFAYQSAPNTTAFMSTGSMYVSRAAYIDTVAQVTSGTYYPSFVDSNNAAAGWEPVYTTSSFSVNPSTGWVTAGVFAATNNGNGTNFKVGDDAWIGDVNVADTLRVMGQQNSANGYIIFGSSDTTALGRAGAGSLTYGGNIIVHAGNTGTTYVQDANVSTNLRAGTAGQLHYQTAANTSGFINTATTGNFLQANYVGAPTWTTTASMYVGRAVIADSASGSSAQVQTVANPSAATFYPTFVSANNASATAASVYTTSSFIINSATKQVGIGGFISTSSLLTVNGRIESMIDPAGEGGQLVLRGKTYRWSFDNYYDTFRIIREDDVTEANGTSPFQISSGTTSVLIGYGNASPTTSGEKFGVTGGVYVSGTVTATTFVGALTGTASKATNLVGGVAGSLPYQSAADSTTFLGIGTNGYVLTSNGTAPTWAALSGLSAGSATTATNLAGGQAWQIPYQTAPGSTAFASSGTTGQFWQATTNGAPAWTTTANIYVQNAVLATHQRGGTAGQLQYQSAVDTTAFINTATTGNFLQANYVGAPTWTGTASMYVQDAVVSTNIRAGAAGSLPYQSGANATTFLGIGANGYVLTSNGTAPTWTAASSLTAGSLTNSHSTGTGILGASYNGSAAVTWSLDTSTLMTKVVNLASGAAGSVPYQSAANATTFLSIGSANTVMMSNGSAPTWTASPTFGGNVTITGNLTVQGTTTYVDSTVTNIGDPIVTIGGGANGAAPASNDGKDRGIAFQWHNGTVAKVGFFGYKNSTGKMTFIPDATITNEVVTGTKGALDANLAGGAAGSIPYQSAADTTTFLSIGTNGYVLTSNGTAPTWTALSGLSAGSATTASNAAVAYSTIGTLTAGTGLSGTAFNGSANQTWTLNTSTLMNIATQVVQSHSAGAGLTGSAYNGSTAQTWTLNTATLMATTLNLANGAAGSLPYQSGANATTFLGIGTNGYVLTSNGTAPTWAAASGITAGAVTYALTMNNSGSGDASGTTYNGSAARTISYNTVGAPSTGGANATGTWPISITGNAYTVNTVAQTANGVYYPAFVDSNNGTATAESVYTTSSFAISPMTGNVMIGGNGTTSTNKLEVRGTAGQLFSVNDSFTGTIFSANDVSGIPSIEVLDTGLVKLAQYNGQVAISTSTAQTNMGLTVNSSTYLMSLGVGTVASGTTGEIRATNEITAYYSDRRLKENVKVIDNAVTKVLSLNGITYTPNALAESFGYDRTTKLVGLFADEVEAILPEATRPAPFDVDENGNSKSGEDYKTIQYEKLVPLLIEAVKEQQGIIDTLKAELASIKNLITKG
jgi:hypothetical protein